MTTYKGFDPFRLQLKDFVCSLNQAKRIKELGINDPAFFIHDEIPFEIGNSIVRERVTHTHNYTGNFPAYTAKELADILINIIETKNTR